MFKIITPTLFLLLLSSISFSQITPNITQQPTDQTVTFGNTATFKVTAESTSGPLGYQWWRVPYISQEESKIVDIPGKISGATSNQLRILNTTMEDDQTQYLCEVKNLDNYPADGYWINSNSATLTVEPSTEEFVRITYPTDELGYEFEVGSVVNIRWISNLVDKVKLEYTTNAGKFWILIEDNIDASQTNYYWSIPNTPSVFCNIKISSTNSSEIFSVSPNDPYLSESYYIYITISGKEKWFSQPRVTSSHLQKMKFNNSSVGFIYGNEVLIITNDGGQTWSLKSNFGAKNLNNVNFVSQNIGWGIKDINHLYKTTDGGINWTQINDNLPLSKKGYNYIRKLQMLDDSLGWLTTNFTEMYRTLDGGIKWNKMGGFWSEILNFNFVNKNEGWFKWVQGDNVSLFQITNNGEFVFGPEEGAKVLNLSNSDDFGAIDFLHYDKSWLFGGTGYYSSLNDGQIKYYNGESYYTQYAAHMIIKGIYFYNESLGCLLGSTLYYDNTIGITRPKSFFICLSIDGGENWELQFIGEPHKINSLYSYNGEMIWAVGDSGLIMRYGNFTETPEYWSRNFLVTNSGSSLDLSFGQSLNATSQIDNDLGESELPPLPPAGTFDARFILNNSSSTILDLRNSNESEIEWLIQFQPGNNGYPITFSWDKETLPFGSFFLRDVIDGSIVNVDMKLEDSYTLTNESINRLKIIYKEQFTAGVANNPDWNLLSVPLAADNMEATSVFPDAASSAFTFDGSYVSTNELNNGVGYWIKFTEEGITNVYGNEPNTPISVKKGWNLVGPYNKEISLEQIQTSPGGIISSDIYGFDNSYYIADKLEVGRGYWVKVNQDGEINFTNTEQLSKKVNSIEKTNEPIFSFNITANDGVSDTISLTFGLDSLATDGYDPLLGEEELPPLPPIGVFDIRIELPDTTITTYSDIRLLAVDCYEYIIKYQLGDSSNGLTLSWNLPEGVTLNISDLVGGVVFNQSFLSGEDSFAISNTNITSAKLRICYNDIVLSENSEELLPDKYSLSQNYPNPFNPSTTIKYTIPTLLNPSFAPARRGGKTGGFVTLKVYDVLGREVATLVNKPQKAGYHEVVFNASNLTSGVYYYKIKAGNFVKTKKMILLK